MTGIVQGNRKQELVKNLFNVTADKDWNFMKLDNL